MVDLTIQTFFDDQWRDAAALTISHPERGVRGPSTLAYELEYFAEHGSIPFSEGTPVRDLRAVSVSAPIDLEDRAPNTWPPFVLDFLPQGRQRERLASFLNMPADAP